MIDQQARHIEICDAVVDVLNAAELSTIFEAERFEDAGAALDELDELRVAVIPQTARRKTITRGGANQLEFDVSIAVLQKVGAKADSDRRDRTDALQLLVEELVETLESEALEGLRPPRQTETKLPAPFAPELLQGKGIFLAPATLTYRQFVNAR